MDKDKVSVIIPTYNYEVYINEAIESVLNQTYKNYEIIIVDDGSTDNTATLLRKYNGRVKYFYQKNQGSSVARNLGLKNSTGEFIAFLDSDDVWLPDKLEKEIKIIQENLHLAFVFSAAYMVNESGKVVKCWDNKNEITMDFKRLYEKNFICASTVLVRSSCLKKVGNFDENLKMSQDWDLWLRLAKKFEFKFISQPLIKYRMHSNNITRKYDERIKYVLAIVNKPEIAGDFSFLKRMIRTAKIYCRWADYCYNNGNIKKARFLYIKAALIFPFVGAYYFTPQAKKISISALFKTIKLYFKIFNCFMVTKILITPLIYLNRFLKHLLEKKLKREAIA